MIVTRSRSIDADDDDQCQNAAHVHQYHHCVNRCRIENRTFAGLKQVNHDPNSFKETVFSCKSDFLIARFGSMDTLSSVGYAFYDASIAIDAETAQLCSTISPSLNFLSTSPVARNPVDIRSTGMIGSKGKGLLSKGSLSQAFCSRRRSKAGKRNKSDSAVRLSITRNTKPHLKVKVPPK